MRALRLDHDPVRARVLLSRYLERHPGGALAEEALAMSIEAAVAHHDPDAAALGARYLKLYPNGPFHTWARQTKR
jgi:outer membrane protein assembly factor BamD (BamD/ComL family)